MSAVQEPNPVRISVPSSAKPASTTPFNQSTANVHYYKQPPTGQKAPPSGHNAEVLSRRTSPIPKGAQHLIKLKGPRRGKKQPISQFIEGKKGWEKGTIKCFCFVYKERVLRRSLSRTSGVPLPPTTNSRKAKPRKEKEIGGAQELQTPALTGATSSLPPTHNVSTPGDPSGQRKGYLHRLGWYWAGWGRE